MSAKQVKAFSAKAAKIVAGVAARYGACYGLAWAARNGLIPVDWATDPEIAVKVALVLTIIVYEAEELVWQRWGIDIPALLAKLGMMGLGAGRSLAAGPLPEPPADCPQCSQGPQDAKPEAKP
jgi:hypothetical protein